MQNHAENTQRIAKNTILLYIRMLFLMVVSLFTSRVILNALGVENYGIYNAVGGIVVMFSILSSSMSSSISRYLTYELGAGNIERLRVVYSSAIIIQILLFLIIAIIAEPLGLWFLNKKMNIPPERVYAANCVFQFSIITFGLGLINLPFNATIISHERMSFFAYISIFEGVSKLVVAYLVNISPIDKLIFYSCLMLMISVIMRVIYGWYCTHNFKECKFKFTIDVGLLKEMFSFAGWNFFGNGSYLVNTQGINLLSNVFFGVTINATRGIATQVDSVVGQFVGNFTMAINPQITKSYASGDFKYMHKLICRGARFSYFLMLILAVPIIVETDMILTLWLKTYPPDTAIFVRFAIASSLTTIIGNTLVTGMMASGNIKRYQLIITSVGVLVFPMTWVAFEFGAPAYCAYLIYFVVYFILIFLRMYLVKDLIKMPPKLYFSNVVLRCLVITVLSFVPATAITFLIQQSVPRLVLNMIVSVLFTGHLILRLGLDESEKMFIFSKLKSISIRKTLF